MLPASEAGRFPGPANQLSRAQAGLRLQLIYDLMEERLVDCRLTLFTRNDQAVANERRRKARVDRDKRLRHDQKYYKLLGWTLLLTNAPKARLPLRTAVGVYRLRWRIEIIFKVWKSHLGLLHASKASGAQMLALVLGLLLFCVLLHESMPAEADASLASLLKVAQFMATPTGRHTQSGNLRDTLRA
ncbi:MAG: Transposase domain [Verrucomicrobiota bacterium]